MRTIQLWIVISVLLWSDSYAILYRMHKRRKCTAKSGAFRWRDRAHKSQLFFGEELESFLEPTQNSRFSENFATRFFRFRRKGRGYRSAFIYELITIYYEIYLRILLCRRLNENMTRTINDLRNIDSVRWWSCECVLLRGSRYETSLNGVVERARI